MTPPVVADTTMAPVAARVAWRHSDNVPVSDCCTAVLLLLHAAAAVVVAEVDDDSVVAAGIVNANVSAVIASANSQHVGHQRHGQD